MSTAWITDPPIPFAELKAAKLPGLKQHFSDKGDYAWTDGQTYLWVYEADGNAVYQVFGEMQNTPEKIARIRDSISREFGVEWLNEHDEGFYDEESESEDEGPESKKLLSSQTLKGIATRVARRKD
jgi:hypothetical protein